METNPLAVRVLARNPENAHAARAALMLAAERCIAERGVAGAPLTLIHTMARQRNTSVTQYYFGSRDGLINAILEETMGPADAHRLALLDRLCAESGPLPPLREVISVWITPLAEKLVPRPEGNYYLRFLDRLRHEAAGQFGGRIVAVQPSYKRFFALLHAHMERFPERVRQLRIALAAEQFVSALARLEAELGLQPPGEAIYPQLAVELLIDYVTGGLSIPLSTATEASLAHPSKVNFHLNFSNEPATP